MNDAAGWTPNLSWLTERIAVGGRFPSERVATLRREMGIGAIVDLRSEQRDDEALLERHGIAFLHLPTDDHGALSPQTIREGLRFVDAAIARGRKILIHCEHGIGRSATLALCAMVEQGFEPMQALALAKDRRALISPSPAQYECWRIWLEEVRRVRGLAWSVPDFDAFRSVAYRHLPDD